MSVDILGELSKASRQDDIETANQSVSRFLTRMHSLLAITRVGASQTERRRPRKRGGFAK